MRMLSFFGVFAVFALSAQADEPVTSPYATGGEVKILDIGNFRTAYIHTFTNTAEAATFANTSGRTLKLRYLVVGAGGFGIGGWAGNNGGGGGGGGGVCEKKDFLLETGESLAVFVGKGAASKTQMAGASAISNGVAEVEFVPGGGNGGTRTGSGKGTLATAGAAGGGGGLTDWKTPGKGTYQSSILGVVPAGTEPGKGFSGGTGARCGAGGGGAGSAGKSGDNAAFASGGGGAGLLSEITGETLYYGAGGGGGFSFFSKVYGGGGLGGSGSCGGDGARVVFEDNGDGTVVTNYLAATKGAANSGGGGGGGGMVSVTAGAAGADGVVIIRYEIASSPCDGGDVVTRTELRPGKFRYLHVFTNAVESAEFVNRSGKDLKLRYLVVGGGGSGSNSHANHQVSGGGGGGGGVCEKDGIAFANGTVWTVTVGVGAATRFKASRASSISNGVAEVELVPGGGNAGQSWDPVVDPTPGAAGGGGTWGSANGSAGTYESSILGVSSGGPYSGGPYSYRRTSGGGGGAGGAAESSTYSATPRHGGRGLVSEITGEPLMYGSGGGGGGTTSTLDGLNGINGGLGGRGDARAANGGGWTTEMVDEVETRVYFAATEPAANSGNGGAGARFGGGSDSSTGGADGVVIIRYDYVETPQGLMLIVR